MDYIQGESRMLYARDFREQACDALTGRWNVAVGTGIVAVLLGAGGENVFRLNYSWKEPIQPFYNPALITILLGFIFFVSTYALILFFIGGAVKLGYAKFNLNLIKKSDARFDDLFSKFDMFWNGFIMQFFMYLFTFLWSLLFIIPGIIAALSYSMTPYILLEHPEMSALDAIKCSKEMMRGNKGRLFCLELSFIGWMLLSILTWNIGFLFLNPYKNAANAAFYLDVSGKN